MRSTGLWALLLVSQITYAASGVMLREEVLRSEPAMDARVIAPISRGTPIEIEQRAGGWMRVSTAAQSGWVRVFSVRGGQETAPASLWGRIKSAFVQSSGSSQRAVAVAGLRGTDPVQIFAEQGENAVLALERYRPDKTQAEEFANEVGLTQRNVRYFDVDTQPDAGLARWLKRGSSTPMTLHSLSLPTAVLLGKTTPAQDARIGAHIAGQILQKSSLLQNTAVQRYVNLVGNRVAMQSESSDLPWRFAVLESSELFAIAAPGGFVFLTAGLYQNLDSEAELAALLGSQIAQVIRRQPMAYLQSQAQTLSFTPSTSTDADAAYLADLLGDASEYLGRTLDASSVFEADRSGLVLATRAGYAPYALGILLQNLGQIPPTHPDMALYARSHPPLAERLQRLEETLGSSMDALSGQLQEKRFQQFNPIAQ